MKVDYFYKGKPYGSRLVGVLPKVGDTFKGKMVYEVEDFRGLPSEKTEGTSQVTQCEVLCRLSDGITID